MVDGRLVEEERVVVRLVDEPEMAFDRMGEEERVVNQPLEEKMMVSCHGEEVMEKKEEDVANRLGEEKEEVEDHHPHQLKQKNIYYHGNPSSFRL